MSWLALWKQIADNLDKGTEKPIFKDIPVKACPLIVQAQPESRPLKKKEVASPLLVKNRLGLPESRTEKEWKKLTKNAWSRYVDAVRRDDRVASKKAITDHSYASTAVRVLKYPSRNYYKWIIDNLMEPV